MRHRLSILFHEIVAKKTEYNCKKDDSDRLYDVDPIERFLSVACLILESPLVQDQFGVGARVDGKCQDTCTA